MLTYPARSYHKFGPKIPAQDPRPNFFIGGIRPQNILVQKIMHKNIETGKAGVGLRLVVIHKNTLRSCKIGHA